MILKRKDGTPFVGKAANSRGKAARNMLMELFSQYRPERPLEGPVQLRVFWAYGWRKSEPKKNRVPRHGEKYAFKWCDTRPDCDNLVKLVKDVLTDLGYWNDDAQVARLVFTKMWHDRPHITIQISRMED